MSDKEFVIEMEDDTEGHGVRRAIIEPDESEWLEERLRRDSGKTNFRITLRDEDQEDTEGHGGAGTTLRLNLVDEDDTEGHAIAIHFPSRADADAFRRRLLVTGVLVGTVALGAAGGVGLSALQSDDQGAGAASTTQSQAYANYQEAAANEGARQGGAAAADAQAYANYQEAAANEGARQGGAAAAQSGPMDAAEGRAAAAADAQAYANYQEAAANEGARQGGGAAAQTGPMDVNEARALQAGASSVDADRDIGIMDASGAAAGTRTGPMDVNEARALQAGASSVDADRDIGIMDASGAAAPTSDEDASPDLKGPAPR